jgi:hypothetical protein
VQQLLNLCNDRARFKHEHEKRIGHRIERPSVVSAERNSSSTDGASSPHQSLSSRAGAALLGFPPPGMVAKHS